MCLWISHDWRESESWWHEVYINGVSDYCETSVVGYECRRCGQRKIKKTGGWLKNASAPGPYKEALAWMKEERIK